MAMDELKGTVCICTLGCAKNEVDSQKMADALRAAGYAVTREPEAADAVVVNTCSFIQAATEESIEAVLEAAALPGVERGECAVIVAGCMPARYGDELSAELAEVAAFVPCREEGRIVEAVEGALAGLEARRAHAAAPEEPPAQASFAYVKISDGCERCCAYCTIPFIRGRYHSFPFADIERDVRRAVDAGAREVVLIAQDTGRWGDDLGEGCGLPWLLDELAQRFPDTWLRVMYLQPDGVTDELLDVIAAHDNIADYLDIPLQHVDPAILEAMNRGGSRARFEQLAARVRERIPGVTLRTTLIAGFPGETDAQFEELEDFAASGCFDYIGVFPYSREEGTRAAAMDGQLDEDEKAYRAQRIQDAADSAGAAATAERVGTRQAVLVEGCEEDGQLVGRTMQQAPEVDGVTFVDAGAPGQVVCALIEDSLLYDMEGSVVDA